MFNAKHFFNLGLGFQWLQKRGIGSLKRPYNFPKPVPGPKHKDVLSLFEKKCRSVLDEQSERFKMFHRSQPNRVRPGAVLLVESYSKYPSKDSVNRFAGYLLRIRHRGPKSSILLRNVVMGVGVEYLLPIYSPQIKRIVVLKENGLSKRPRRAYLSYLRQPRFRLPPVESLVRKYIEQNQHKP
ncbi:mitochondrial ribosomal protein subunit L19 [Schizosaccharomyces pombe]|uniref:Large ribosomal subunit protein bL19m n=1 Tax=Schizosaccharomyces pombe (strain 972 / ATCC 24843) TaxID=284812 RepID=IMG1_SCHPO|nr:putative mitochondrial ribosomal protein subunit L19 [Schizosaccharomyces pombe]Q9UT87.1 RecName: Full=Large ribosomal subunit protein bL19m; AltName: Full=54S ribosomal protein subunit img1, mitochondrial; Flags: Precursor [Schizosaccharomyces pombe 972h-]CAB52265.1 mitochondrial ribosomal protein subunit L19 (predicted) [Schizosaccharomyces pombe]|eukprot:NP_593422.1 putative mitochondrial ribosomal protein subunit L19 [Schizosaccharomyces pombe]